ncbi:hypothetical protein ATANTOWER_006098 [Ataeniobius toweri]|uniref:Uncharacterized protein n=1 Tax=Ataeniobius toweri TaxID=208326 RepID=A0ABU7ANB7_9TELE|nr:hypothetical protein [Ataeniobius toweri]
MNQENKRPPKLTGLDDSSAAWLERFSGDTWWSLELTVCWSLRTCVCGLLLLETLAWKPTILRPATLSLPWTWNTNGLRNLKHLPPGFLLPPPPTLPPSQEPDESSSIIHCK